MRHAAVRDGWVGLREKVTVELNPLFPSWTSLSLPLRRAEEIRLWLLYKLVVICFLLSW